MDQASTGLHQEYLLDGWKEKVVQAYYKYMVDVAEVLGAKRQQAENELAESLNFEMELAKVTFFFGKLHMYRNPIENFHTFYTVTLIII